LSKERSTSTPVKADVISITSAVACFIIVTFELPETTQVGEIEIGYAFTDSIHASANVFAQEVKNTIELRGFAQVHFPEIARSFETVVRKPNVEHGGETLVFTSDVSGAQCQTVIDYAFLKSPEFVELRAVCNSFQSAGPAPYTLR
jgi:thiamine phosphate synthase YjbQ (UPF0047 family)